MSDIAHRLDVVHRRIADVERAASRPAGTVALLAVSKTVCADDVRVAYACGQHAFGENYVQEACAKIEELADLRARLEWHFIGPLQSNKTRLVATHFDWVDSVDRLKLALRLSEQRPSHLPPLNVCIQVNVSGEASKSGVEPDAVLPLAAAVAALPRLRLRGLMAIPEPLDDFELQREPHRRLHALWMALRAAGQPLDTLSMGMSADLEAAIFEGATMVRIGSAIFGARAPLQTVDATL